MEAIELYDDTKFKTLEKKYNNRIYFMSSFENNFATSHGLKIFNWTKYDMILGLLEPNIGKENCIAVKNRFGPINQKYETLKEVEEFLDKHYNKEK